MKKEEYSLILLLCLTIYLLLNCLGRIFDLKIGDDKKERLEVFQEQSKSYYFPQNITRVVTDIVLVNNNSVCPSGYTLTLPYLMCDEVKQGFSPQNQERNVPIDSDQFEHCYSSSSDRDHLFFRDFGSEIKVCNKIIYPPNFRYYQLPFYAFELCYLRCDYLDTKVQGWLPYDTDCASYSFEQKCQLGQYKFESQFMITCLEDKNYGLEMSQFTCASDEIACVSDQILYCLKNTEKCPIQSLFIYGYQEDQISFKRNQLNFPLLTGLEIVDLDKQNVEIILGIEVRGESNQGDSNQADRILVDMENEQQIGLKFEENKEVSQKANTAENITAKQFILNRKLINQEKVVIKKFQEFIQTNPYRVNASECVNFIKDITTSYKFYYKLILLYEAVGIGYILKQLSNKNDYLEIRSLISINALMGSSIWAYTVFLKLSCSSKLRQYSDFIDNFDQDLHEQIYSSTISDILINFQFIVYFIIFLKMKHNSIVQQPQYP